MSDDFLLRGLVSWLESPGFGHVAINRTRLFDSTGKGVIFRNIPPEFGKKVVRIIVCESAPTSMVNELRTGMQQLRVIAPSFSFDLVDNGGTTTDNVNSELVPPGPCPSRTTINRALDVLRLIMGKEKCRFRNGRIYQYTKESTFTFLPM